MNWLKKGPELKMPKLKRPSLKRPSSKGFGGKVPAIKPPAFLADLYYDLRDRRLLLPLALVLVAIAAVPFLLGDSEPVEPPPAVSAVPETGPPASASLAVVEATPGLRDYRKRLDNRTATNPFKQRYTSLPESAQVESTSVTSSTVGGESTVSGEAPSGSEADGGSSPGSSGGSPPASAGGGGAGGAPNKPRLFEFVVDVQISRSETTADGRHKMGEPSVRRKVEPLTQLPGEKALVVTTMGINLHTAKVMFLVSDDVKSLDGEFQCVGRTPEGICELLEVETGFPLELIYGPDEVRYRIKPTKIDVIRSGSIGDERSSKIAGLEARRGFSLQHFSK
jgi:hypothetical protein